MVFALAFLLILRDYLSLFKADQFKISDHVHFLTYDMLFMGRLFGNSFTIQFNNNSYENKDIQ